VDQCGDHHGTVDGRGGRKREGDVARGDHGARPVVRNTGDQAAGAVKDFDGFQGARDFRGVHVRIESRDGAESAAAAPPERGRRMHVPPGIVPAGAVRTHVHGTEGVQGIGVAARGPVGGGHEHQAVQLDVRGLARQFGGALIEQYGGAAASGQQVGRGHAADAHGTDPDEVSTGDAIAKPAAFAAYAYFQHAWTPSS